MLELAGRGHHVTEVTPFLESKIFPNYTQIEVNVEFAKASGGNGKRTRAEMLHYCGAKFNFFQLLVMLTSSLVMVLTFILLSWRIG
jgi:hypothetical protein